MKKLLIFANNVEGLYSFRYELLEKLINEKFEISEDNYYQENLLVMKDISYKTKELN